MKEKYVLKEFLCRFPGDLNCKKGQNQPPLFSMNERHLKFIYLR